ncbi:hypothetical protein QMK19_27555 [Streptomyces sp. H10-C2]|uniref:hypothetical protein n=1 Tax=unclassified Streptomyces TaxID=2593676 RepID=UPI0024B94B0C|nr:MULTISPECIES: hypothetical protein [unclassified Streptomyces]MDJ0343789.1 hypothetical protein [Streptomyces sp. PH10-H1]MDJ0373310.1 hypothetical protein [Streptomyces sp. H10-C2]
MQPSAGPALPHTRARTAHWISTAALVGAVIGAGALVQPADASSHGSDVTTQAAPDPRAAKYPLDCAGAPVDVVSSVSGDLDRDGRPETVVVVRCHAEAGTPPSGVYVLAPGAAPGSAPRVVATLVDPAEQRSITGFGLQGRIVRATVLGFSSDATPRCCPDQKRTYTWQWRAGRYYATPGALANGI